MFDDFTFEFDKTNQCFLADVKLKLNAAATFNSNHDIFDENFEKLLEHFDTDFIELYRICENKAIFYNSFMQALQENLDDLIREKNIKLVKQDKNNKKIEITYHLILDSKQVILTCPKDDICILTTT